MPSRVELREGQPRTATGRLRRGGLELSTRVGPSADEMEIGIVIEGISDEMIRMQPWMHYAAALAQLDIHIRVYEDADEAFQRPFDAMLLHVWQDWENKQRFDPCRILPVMEKYATYRAEFPETVQIVLNHTDMADRPYATPYWRPGDPILYRTPAYDRSKLYPFPPEQIWPYEMIWGGPCFVSDGPPSYRAGFIGSPSGRPGYRERVAVETAKVGVGLCAAPRPYQVQEYNALMASCRIIVCPRGWGEQSQRHWDAWLSGKPVLTDRACDSAEMIPGLRLREGIHYLVFDDPREIPDIVADWTRPSRLDDLAEIAENGRRAALSYDGRGRIAEFFNRSVGEGTRTSAGPR
jgi:hypothetical protein